MNGQNKIETTRLFRAAALVFAATGMIVNAQPVITKQPVDQTASLFADATFQLSATGAAPLSYQWRFGGANLVHGTNAFLTVTNVHRASAGIYDAIVVNASGSITSRVATLTITLFNSMFEFGFSWTGYHDCPRDAASYWQNRASNGPVWPEYLSTNLGLAYAEANNYAHCGDAPADILNQVISYAAPKKPQLSLYCFWAEGPSPAGVSDLARALTNDAVGDQLLNAAVSSNTNAINRLYSKGARTILIEDDMDWTQCPPGNVYDFGTNTALTAKYSEYIVRYNARIRDAIAACGQTRPDLRLVFVDVWSKFNEVLANAAKFGFTKTDIDALDDRALVDTSFNGLGADYLFWDPNHPTTKLHRLVASWHLEALTNSFLETLEVQRAGLPPVIQMNHLQIGHDYTLQQSPDLKTWTDMQTFTAAGGTNQWTAESGGAGAGSATFYRLKWQPWF